MERLLTQPKELGSLHSSISPKAQQARTNGQVLSALSNTLTEDKINLSFDDLYKALSVTAQEVLNKLNELLKDKVPQGVQHLRPEDHTPEKTATRIVDSVTGLFAGYAKQHPEMEDEELLTSFMEQVRSGVDKGYDDAFKILEDIGAFQFDGVKSGIEETKSLITEKLNAFEERMRKQLGIDPVSSEQISKETTDELLAQGGAATVQIAA